MAPQADTRLRQLLAALPDPPLPDDLWPRIARARTRQLAVRRGALGATVAVLVAAFALPVVLPPRHDVPGAPVPVAATPATGSISADVAVRLRSLDRELQAAYLRGAGDAEIAPLWEARAALLDRRSPATSPRPVRI